ncbi:MAG: NADH-quinone oxidoreductase subunit J [Gammaproteobacteria bacterium]
MELFLFYTAAFVAVLSTVMVITRLNAVHALLYLIVSLLAVGMVFYLLGAHFAAVLEVIVYAGAIMVLFVFVIMMLNLGHTTVERERSWLQPSIWVAPGLLAGILFIELIFVMGSDQSMGGATLVGAKEVGILLFGPYLLAVELASMLLLAGLVGAYHLGRPDPKKRGQGK